MGVSQGEGIGVKLRSFFFMAVAVSASANIAPATGESHLLIVSGLSGEPGFKEHFHQMSISLLEAAQSQ